MLTGFGIAIGFILVVLLRVIDMDKGDIYYYVRQLPKTEQYDIVQVKLRTVTDKYYVGVFTDGSRVIWQDSRLLVSERNAVSLYFIIAFL